MQTYRKIFIILMVSILLGCKPQSKPPRLVVLIALDHLAYDTFSHYQPVFTGGLKWLVEHGITFDNAHLEHGYASTGPGHFVLGSGLHPGPAGQLGNHFYDRQQKRDLYCIEDPESHELDIPAYSVSYQNVRGSTFGDWLKAASPESRVYAVACKDRAAVLLGGREADLAVWYNWRGAFTTNDFYTESIPAWLNAFNTENNMQSYRDSIWSKSLPESAYAEYAHADSFYGESDRYMTESYSPVFPIGFEEDWDDGKIFGEMGGRPWMDRMTLELAARAVHEGGLGQDDIPDVLTIGLSAMDIIAHYYGPYSHEAMDLLVKIDQYLEVFLKDLDNQVGLENVHLVLSTDHGGLPLPEHRTIIQKKPGGRINQELYTAARAQAYDEIKALYASREFIVRRGDTYFYDQLLMDSLGVNAAVVDSIIQSNIEAVEGIYRVYTKAELLAAKPEDRNAYRLGRFMHPELSPDLYTLVEPGWIFRGPFGTSHMTPYDYDSHITLIYSNANMSKTSISDSIASVDIAPTLGDILGVKPLNHVDGKSLKSLLTNTPD